MNNEHPVGKAKVDGKYYKEGKLPPKQKLMYDITNSNSSWGNDEITNHRKATVELLNSKEKILYEAN